MDIENKLQCMIDNLSASYKNMGSIDLQSAISKIDKIFISLGLNPRHTDLDDFKSIIGKLRNRYFHIRQHCRYLTYSNGNL